MDPEQINACAGLVQRGDPDRFRAIMAAPVAAREKLFPLFAFNIEVSRAPWVTQESMIAEMRLQWWRDALEEIGQAAEVRRHEVVTPLAEFLTPEDCQLLDRAIEARRWDIYKDPFENEEAFRNYLDDTMGNLLVVACRSLGSFDESIVREFAFSHAVSRWLLAVAELENHNRQPLVDRSEAAIKILAQEALDRRAAACRAQRQVHRDARAALYCVWQDRRYLQQVIHNPMKILSGEPPETTVFQTLDLLRLSITGRIR